MCPIIRNGNGIYGNSIEPDNIEKNKKDLIIDALIKCYKDIMKKSNPNEKIEFCTLTNLHNYIGPDDGYKEITINEIPMIDDNFYCDIIKNDIKNYVICGNIDNIKKYIPKYEYEIDRSKNYVYSKDQIEDKLLIEQKINEIEYTSINSKLLTEEEKEDLNRKFERLKIDDFSYIICGEDWFIGMTNNYELKTTCLKDDYRAVNEFMIELKNVKTNYEIYTTLINDKYKRKFEKIDKSK